MGENWRDEVCGRLRSGIVRVRLERVDGLCRGLTLNQTEVAVGVWSGPD